MVTITIKQQNVPRYFMEIKLWIKNGITNDAIYALRDQWDEINYIYSNTDNVRNKIHFDNINPVIKW